MTPCTAGTAPSTVLLLLEHDLVMIDNEEPGRNSEMAEKRSRRKFSGEEKSVIPRRDV